MPVEVLTCQQGAVEEHQRVVNPCPYRSILGTLAEALSQGLQVASTEPSENLLTRIPGPEPDTAIATLSTGENLALQGIVDPSPTKRFVPYRGFLWLQTLSNLSNEKIRQPRLEIR